MKTVIHWFRRDLRITDNTALSAAARERARVIPVYVLSGWHGAHRWTGANRQQFLCGCLSSLAGNLEAIGGKLILRRGDAVGELEKLAVETGAEAVFFNRDPDPHGRAVEEDLAKACERSGLRVHSFKDVCIHEGNEILNGSGQPFRVFTPYSKAWAKVPRPGTSPRPRDLGTPAGIASLPLPVLSDWGFNSPAPGLPESGEKAAIRRLKAFLSGGLARYADGRDSMGSRHTSCISQDLRFGLLSIREVFQEVESAAAGLPAAGRGSAEKFSSELVWREFYMQILRHFPNVLEEEFNPVFRGMRWPGSAGNFQRWKDGETGFPIVDAAMRELRQTGFMHNRARMITAMFLTKDLHLDWRLGEQFFMQKLTDGEIASNNGGWQWSAGTGADAAPYFRIQNPWTQTRRHDPGGVYIKTWIPGLRDIAPEKFFAPPPDGISLAKNYPLPVVDHSRSRDVTLDLFAAQKQKALPAGSRKGFC
ncbi:MAG: deoxyribodipyrimidine photo-lyase [Verrucomicrobiaceae bacterium]|nr:MAG: deoxyribodipyrimidine photo-lyase [Verrucomicrobiaceae bacterium]